MIYFICLIIYLRSFVRSVPRNRIEIDFKSRYQELCKLAGSKANALAGTNRLNLKLGVKSRVKLGPEAS
jgi:hypothetical protein